VKTIQALDVSILVVILLLFCACLGEFGRRKNTGTFCGQLSCSVLKEITLRPGTPVPIGDMDCKCSRWDEVPVE
jgi:hypothetical protein